MQHFPVVTSTLSPVQLGPFLQQRYKFGTGTSCRLLRAAINHAYLVTDGDDKYVFRIYSLNWRSENEIKEEIGLLRLLNDNGVPVSYAIPDATGNYLQALHAPEGLRWGVLFSYAKGEKVFNYDAGMNYKIGAIMGRMHQITNTLTINRVTYTPQSLLVDSFEQLKQYISHETEEMQFMQRAQQYLLQEFNQVNTEAIRHGVVHLDIWFDNLNIYNNEEVTLFDFDFCGNGWLVLDIAYYMLQLFGLERDPEQYNLKWDSFIKGYTSVTGITEEEMRIIPFASVSIYFFYLGVQCQRFENWTNTFLNETYLKRFITVLVKRLYEYHKLPLSALV
jgi:Ser/Thr protein kinase RdoA (MazF antagonist)